MIEVEKTNQIGLEIRRLYKEKGFNRTSFAKKIGMSMGWLYKVERGNSVGYEQRIKIEEVLGIKIWNV